MICATGHNQCTGCYYCEEDYDNHKASCWFLEDAQWLIEWALRECEETIRHYGTINGRTEFYYGRKEVVETTLDYALFQEKDFWGLWKCAKNGLKELGFGIFKDKMEYWILFFEVKNYGKVKEIYATIKKKEGGATHDST